MRHGLRWACRLLALMGGLAAAGTSSGAPFDTGVDISYLPQIESVGGVYRDGGVAGDAMRILRDHGATTVRLRLWHTPPAGWCDLDHSLAMARRAKALGMRLLLDIHYSDTWADPAHQVKPAAWTGLPFAQLVAAVHDYTRDTLAAFAAQGTVPDMVQVGNEITAGIVWPDGQLNNTPNQNWPNLAALLKAGVNGVHDGLPAGAQTRIIIHVDNGGSNAVCRWFFDALVANGVPFDVIGLSYYPWWHGRLTALQSNMNDISKRYGKDVAVVETGYPWTLAPYDSANNIVGLSSQLEPGYPATPDGQYRFLSAVLRAVMSVPGGRGIGVYYWAPEAIAAPGFGSPWENVALFDFDGNVQPAADAFRTQAATLALMIAGGLRGGTTAGNDLPAAVAALRRAWAL